MKTDYHASVNLLNRLHTYPITEEGKKKKGTAIPVTDCGGP
jgi:hypothetical protein